MNIPFVDLPLQHRNLANELASAIQGVMARADFILGEDVARFEAEFAAFCHAEYAIGVDNGMSALELALRAYGIGPGDEVILPANTFIATAAVVTVCGAKPILVDVDPATFNIDCAQIEPAITPHTRAILPVHLYGLPSDMDRISEIANKHHLIVIEDACQAHGALYKGRRVGSIGNAGAFSFYPGKNMGACGDGGILVTSDAQLADKVRNMRNYGQTKKYHHDLLPFNRRLDTMQAAILRVKLRHLDSWNEARRRSTALYTEILSQSGVVTPCEVPESTHVYHLYVIRTQNRDALQTHLREHGISTGIHYPIPIHLQQVYGSTSFRQGQFPVTEQLSGEILSLPMFPELTAEQVRYVTKNVSEFALSTHGAQLLSR